MIIEELASFISSGISINIATRSHVLEPEGTRAWAVRVEEDRVHLVVYLHEGGSESILRDLQDNGRAALAFSRPSDHRSCQLKGVFVEARACRPDERDEVERQADGFLRELEALGIPRVLTARWAVWPCLGIRIRVTDLFHQTPGPGAGERLP